MGDGETTRGDAAAEPEDRPSEADAAPDESAETPAAGTEAVAGEPDAPQAAPAEGKKSSTCLIVGIIGCGCGVVAVAVLVVLSGMMLPALSKARESARRAQCMSNLKMIGLALNMYAQDYDEAFPPDLETLYREGYVTDSGVYFCPTASREGKAPEKLDPGTISYVYVANLRTTNPADYIVAFDKPTNHGGEGVSVLHISGWVDWRGDADAVRSEVDEQIKALAAEGRKNVKMLGAGD